MSWFVLSPHTGPLRRCASYVAWPSHQGKSGCIAIGATTLCVGGVSYNIKIQTSISLQQHLKEFRTYSLCGQSATMGTAWTALVEAPPMEVWYAALANSKRLAAQVHIS
mmetsp:Transcript_41163/g.92078  ORF Transcript_41163/g.92078 Transcript_41163/m.92078 type:complete len:109 (+) Transcript_41163:96-422(+)